MWGNKKHDKKKLIILANRIKISFIALQRVPIVDQSWFAYLMSLEMDLRLIQGIISRIEIHLKNRFVCHTKIAQSSMQNGSPILIQYVLFSTSAKVHTCSVDWIGFNFPWSMFANWTQEWTFFIKKLIKFSESNWTDKNVFGEKGFR